MDRLNKILLFFVFTIATSWYLLKDKPADSIKHQVPRQEAPPVVKEKISRPAKVNKKSLTKKMKKPIVIKENKIKNKINIIAPQSAPISSKNIYKMKSESVEFEVKDGYAVAFGDVILGTLQPGAKIKTGRYKTNRTRLWDSPYIPYAFHKDLKNRGAVEQAINYFNNNTPIQFVPFQGQEDAVIFRHVKEHCFSYLGRVGGHQSILISNQCQKGHIIHEIMHALGFVHEQSRTDRDNYVEIKWENIQEKYLSQFALVPEGLIHEYTGSVFDFNYKSIMLYKANAFAKKSDLKTMTSKTQDLIEPYENELSAIDKERLEYLYN